MFPLLFEHFFSVIRSNTSLIAEETIGDTFGGRGWVGEVHWKDMTKILSEPKIMLTDLPQEYKYFSTASY